MLQNGLAKGVKPAPFAIVAGVGFHLLTPFPLGMAVVLSLSANRAFSGTGFARKTAFRRDKSEEKFSGRRKRQKSPGRSETRRAKDEQ
jgi:hypothetical protein